MSEQYDKILIRAASRYGRPHTLSDYQALSRSHLEHLREIHPIFRRLTAVGRRYLKCVPEDLVGLENLIVEQCYDADRPHDYLDTLNGRLAPGSRCLTGFSLSYCSQLESASPSLLPVERGGIDLTLRGCSVSIESSASAVLQLPTDQYGELHTAEITRRLLEANLDTWKFTQGSVGPHRYGQMIREGNPASYAGQWLFYLPFPHLGECLPSDIHWEPFHSGILIETTPHIPDANSAEDVAAGKRVRDALEEFGLISHATYAIEGWPPDREEWRYEELITGAPSDRKYVVHCINFDGYDAQRDVLLYAKLFRPLRRQPKEWGLRGWDGPVLNEARRQVRAATKAGGVPIEWHIGIEEAALRVRQLLADFSNITERQLKVIHTPPDAALSPIQ